MMHNKTCDGCGKPFEAVKSNRRWCSDLCGKQARRRAAALPKPASSSPAAVAIPVRSPDCAATDTDTVAYIRSQLAFARAVDPGVVLSVDLVDGLLTDAGVVPDEVGYDVVERVLVERAIARLKEVQADPGDEQAVVDAQAAMNLLAEVWSDTIDDRVVAALAMSLS